MRLPTFTAQTIKARNMRDELLNFIGQESKKADGNERLLGSSEIMESIFGKVKRLEHDQAKSGFTVFTLSLAAIVSETTTEVVHKALEMVPTNKIYECFKKNIGSSVQSKKMYVNKQCKKEKQKQELLCAA